ncbi:hypothetical protein F5Y05DRAFT_422248 [Hypoxylon sp. FL0543]|nr:hypothetical protein F5Y05DRAFT_422248 [Hypoxylon sp. FL0543]
MNSASARPPTPPPLPPQSSTPRISQKPSQYLRDLEVAGDDVWKTTAIASASPRKYAPKTYFFYGTLTRPEILKQVLDLDYEPIMRPAKIVGYSLTKWGDYNALIDGEPGEEVTGMAYEVSSLEHEYKLAYYEANAYELVPCLIDYTDGKQPSQVIGSTFKYPGDAAALKEGRFDRKLWEFRMGSRLPEKWNDKKGH